jgi:hypothetical protein
VAGLLRDQGQQQELQIVRGQLASARQPVAIAIAETETAPAAVPAVAAAVSVGLGMQRMVVMMLDMVSHRISLIS